MALTQIQIDALKTELRRRLPPTFVEVKTQIGPDPETDVQVEMVPQGVRIDGVPGSSDELLIMADWDTPPADPELAINPRNWGGRRLSIPLNTFVDMWGDLLHGGLFQPGPPDSIRDKLPDEVWQQIEQRDSDSSWSWKATGVLDVIRGKAGL